jgi:hypothetical protein
MRRQAMDINHRISLHFGSDESDRMINLGLYEFNDIKTKENQEF